MNYSVVIYILGWIMEIEAAFLALPGIVSAIYGEKGGFAFLWVALGSAVAGSAIILRKPKNMRFYLREGFRIRREMIDEDTREEEYLMEWSKEAGKE